MKDMYVVFGNEEGVIIVTDDYNEALKEYKKHKEDMEDWYREGYLDEDDELILAKIDKRIYAYNDVLSLVLKDCE